MEPIDKKDPYYNYYKYKDTQSVTFQDDSYAGMSVQDRRELWEMGMRPADAAWDLGTKNEGDKQAKFIYDGKISDQRFNGQNLKPRSQWNSVDRRKEMEAKDFAFSGRSAPIPWENKTFSSAEKLVESIEYYRKNLTDDDRFSASELVGGAVKRMPLTFGIPTIIESAQMSGRIDRIYDGTASGTDYSAAARDIVMAEMAENDPAVMKVFRGVSELPGYAADIFLTGGTSAFGKKLGKSGYNVLVKRLGAKKVEKLLGKATETLARKSVQEAAEAAGHHMAGAAIHAGVTRVGETAAKALPQRDLQVADPNFQGEMTDTGFVETEKDSIINSLPKAVAQQMSEYLVERMGTAFIGRGMKGLKEATPVLKNLRLPAKSVPKAADAFIKQKISEAWKKQNPKRANLGSKIGYNGMISELGEERLQEVINADIEMIASLFPGYNRDSDQQVINQAGVVGDVITEGLVTAGAIEEDLESREARHKKMFEQIVTEAAGVGLLGIGMRQISGTPREVLDQNADPVLAMAKNPEYATKVHDLIDSGQTSRSAFESIKLPNGKKLSETFRTKEQREFFIENAIAMRDHAVEHEAQQELEKADELEAELQQRQAQGPPAPKTPEQVEQEQVVKEITALDIRRTFPGLTVADTENGYRLNFSTGPVEVVLAESKELSDEQIDQLYQQQAATVEGFQQQYPTPESYNDFIRQDQARGGMGREYIEAVPDDGTAEFRPLAVITLNNQDWARADGKQIESLKHAMVHFAFNTGMWGKKERDALVKQYSNPDKPFDQQSEDIALASAYWRKPGMIQRFKDWVNRVMNKLTNGKVQLSPEAAQNLFFTDNWLAEGQPADMGEFMSEQMSGQPMPQAPPVQQQQVEAPPVIQPQIEQPPVIQQPELPVEEPTVVDQPTSLIPQEQPAPEPMKGEPVKSATDLVEALKPLADAFPKPRNYGIKLGAERPPKADPSLQLMSDKELEDHQTNVNVDLKSLEKQFDEYFERDETEPKAFIESLAAKQDEFDAVYTELWRRELEELDATVMAERIGFEEYPTEINQDVAKQMMAAEIQRRGSDFGGKLESSLKEFAADWGRDREGGVGSDFMESLGYKIKDVLESGQQPDPKRAKPTPAIEQSAQPAPGSRDVADKDYADVVNELIAAEMQSHQLKEDKTTGGTAKEYAERVTTTQGRLEEAQEAYELTRREGWDPLPRHYWTPQELRDHEKEKKEYDPSIERGLREKAIKALGETPRTDAMLEAIRDDGDRDANEDAKQRLRFFKNYVKDFRVNDEIAKHWEQIWVVAKEEAAKKPYLPKRLIAIEPSQYSHDTTTADKFFKRVVKAWAKKYGRKTPKVKTFKEHFNELGFDDVPTYVTTPAKTKRPEAYQAQSNQRPLNSEQITYLMREFYSGEDIQEQGDIREFLENLDDWKRATDLVSGSNRHIVRDLGVKLAEDTKEVIAAVDSYFRLYFARQGTPLPADLVDVTKTLLETNKQLSQKDVEEPSSKQADYPHSLWENLPETLLDKTGLRTTDRQPELQSTMFFALQIQDALGRIDDVSDLLKTERTIQSMSEQPRLLLTKYLSYMGIVPKKHLQLTLKDSLKSDEIFRLIKRTWQSKYRGGKTPKETELTSEMIWALEGDPEAFLEPNDDTPKGFIQGMPYVRANPQTGEAARYIVDQNEKDFNQKVVPESVVKAEVAARRKEPNADQELLARISQEGYVMDQFETMHVIKAIEDLAAKGDIASIALASQLDKARRVSRGNVARALRIGRDPARGPRERRLEVLQNAIYGFDTATQAIIEEGLKNATEAGYGTGSGTGTGQGTGTGTGTGTGSGSGTGTGTGEVEVDHRGRRLDGGDAGTGTPIPMDKRIIGKKAFETLVRERRRLAKVRKFIEDLGYSLDPAGLRKLASDLPATKKVIDKVREIRRPDFQKWVADMVTEYRYGAMLSGPQTQIVNAMSNAFFGGYREFEVFAFAALNSIPGIGDVENLKLTDYKKGYFAEGRLKHAFRHSVSNAFAALTNEFRRNPKTLIEEQIGGESIEKYEIRGKALPGLGGKLYRGIFGFGPMRFVDQFFKTMFAEMGAGVHAARIARLEGLKGKKADDRISDLILNKQSLAWVDALAEAELRLFQDEGGPISKGVIDLLERGRKIPKLGYVARHTVIPFVRTPVRLAANGFIRIPGVGFPIPVQVWNNLRNGKPLLKDVDPAIVGQVSMLILAAMIWNGVSDDEEEVTVTGGQGSFGGRRRSFGYGEGVPADQSFKWNDTWIKYDRADPAAIGVATMVDGIRAFKRTESITDLPGNLTEDIGRSLGGQLQEKTFFRGLGDLMKMYDDKDGYRRWIANQIGSFWPNLLSQSARAGRETIGDKRDESLTREVLKRSDVKRSVEMVLPESMEGIAKDIPDSETIYDHVGRPAKASGQITGLKTKGTDMHIADRVYWNWNEKNPDAPDPKYPTRPSREYTHNKIRRRMDDKTYAEYSRISGEIAGNVIERMIPLKFAKDPTDLLLNLTDLAQSRSRRYVKDHLIKRGSLDGINQQGLQRDLQSSLYATAVSASKATAPKRTGRPEKFYQEELELWRKNRDEARKYIGWYRSNPTQVRIRK